MSTPSPIFTAPQITADQNDYEPDPANSIFALLWRLSSDAARNITGMAGNSFQGTPLPTRLLYVSNVGAFAITLKHEDALSAAPNRFAFAGGLDKVLAAGEMICLLYDSATARWRQSTV